MCFSSVAGCGWMLTCARLYYCCLHMCVPFGLYHRVECKWWCVFHVVWFKLWVVVGCGVWCSTSMYYGVLFLVWKKHEKSTNTNNHRNKPNTPWSFMWSNGAVAFGIVGRKNVLTSCLFDVDICFLLLPVAVGCWLARVCTTVVYTFVCPNWFVPPSRL